MSVSSDKKNLYLFTDEFPWGRGEKAFVEPELEYLCEEYRVNIISLAPSEYLSDYSTISRISAEINVVHYPQSSLAKRLLLGLRLPFYRCGRSEVRRLIKSGFTLGRLASVFYAFGNALDLRFFCSKNHIFSEQEALYYAFWFNTQCLALAIEKEYRANDVHFVARLHGYDLYDERRQYGYQPFQVFKKNMCTRMIFACEHAKEYFIRQYEQESFDGQYLVNYLGVKPREKNLSARSRDGVFRIVSCSSIDRNKRVDLILEALNRTQGINFEWVHFGGGPLEEELKYRAQEKGVNASFRGNVSNNEVIQFYQDNPVDLFITTTASEGGCPVSVQEALSFGIPIVGTDVGGVSEAIRGNGALLGANPSVQEVVRVLRKIAQLSDDEIDSMRYHSKLMWREKFDIRQNKKTLMDELRKTTTYMQ